MYEFKFDFDFEWENSGWCWTAEEDLWTATTNLSFDQLPVATIGPVLVLF